MQGTNVLFGQIAVVFGILIAGVWGATQWTAAALGYQVRLGSPWFDFLGTPIYHPWKLFEWWFVFDAYAPRVFDTGGAIAGGSGLLAVVVAIGMSIWRSRSEEHTSELQSLMRISYAVFCLKKKNNYNSSTTQPHNRRPTPLT